VLVFITGIEDYVFDAPDPDMICWNREKSGRLVFENQIGSLQEHMEEMERVYSDIRGMKHDMKNTLASSSAFPQGKGADAFIRISSLQKGNLPILKVENSFDGRLVRRRQASQWAKEAVYSDSVLAKSGAAATANAAYEANFVMADNGLI